MQQFFGISEEELSLSTTISDLPVPDFSVPYYTSVVLHSNRDTTLPFNAHLGHIRHITNADKTVFAEAAKGTSEQLVNSWETYLYCQQANQNTEQTQVISVHTIKQSNQGHEQLKDKLRNYVQPDLIQVIYHHLS